MGRLNNLGSRLRLVRDIDNGGCGAFRDLSGRLQRRGYTVRLDLLRGGLVFLGDFLDGRDVRGMPV